MTGARQEIGAAAALVRDHRDRTGAATILVVDGAQSVPRLAVDASARSTSTPSPRTSWAASPDPSSP
jgi:selenocysteine lyase/cysteine desulfurase